MITRAHIRRQLRKEGGIMNAVPRQGYGLGSLIKSITKPFKKVVDVGKQVIKSPVGKAALLGLGGAGLMGYGPMSGLSGIGARIGGSLTGVTLMVIIALSSRSPALLPSGMRKLLSSVTVYDIKPNPEKSGSGV